MCKMRTKKGRIVREKSPWQDMVDNVYGTNIPQYNDDVDVFRLDEIVDAFDKAMKKYQEKVINQDV